MTGKKRNERQGKKPGAPRPLTPKQRRFADEYVVDLNATQAAIRAGYSARTAAQQGHELLRKPEIAALISEHAGRALGKAEVTVARVLEELALVGFSDIGGVLDFTGIEPQLRAASDITPQARRTISSVKVRRYVEGSGEDAKTVEVTEFKLWPKDAALEKLGRYLKMFVDRTELTGANGGPIEARYVAEWGNSQPPSEGAATGE